ncbi:hypothetical protein HDU93_005930, partial [Gonapodya sp. JEL0774]
MELPWNPYEPEREFARMGVGTRTNEWRLTRVNEEYQVSLNVSRDPLEALITTTCTKAMPNLPALARSTFTCVGCRTHLCGTFPVKGQTADAIIPSSKRQRKKSSATVRTVSYWIQFVLSCSIQISLTRSAQPLAGITAARSAQDERLIQSIFASGSHHLPQDRVHLIVDARPTVNALAQGVFNGAGMENTENYGRCRMEFLGIDNIHVMRDSHHRMLE